MSGRPAVTAGLHRIRAIVLEQQRATTPPHLRRFLPPPLAPHPYEAAMQFREGWPWEVDRDAAGEDAK